MEQEYFVLSNFGVRYFMENYTDSNTVPASGTNELTDIISCTLGAITKDTKRYKTLGGNGWDSIAPLGQGQDDATFEAIRGGTGDVYAGKAGDSTYTKVRDWFMKSTAQGGQVSPKCIIEVVPRGDNTYEGTAYYVIPAKWGPGKKDTETGQEYTFDVSPFGPQVPLKVTYDEENDSFEFEKVSDVMATSVTIYSDSGATTVKTGAPLQMSASVLPAEASQSVVWSVTPGTGTGTINASGLLTGGNAGTITVVATATDGSGVSGSMVITVTEE